MKLMIESIKSRFYKKNGKEFKPKWKKEKKLEDFIFEHPHILWGKNGHLLGRQIKWADILGLDEQGRLMIVEIKKGGVRIKTVRQIVKHIKRLDECRSNLCNIIKKEWENDPKRRPPKLKEKELKKILKGWTGKIIAVIVGTHINVETIKKFGNLQDKWKCWIALFHRLHIKGKERYLITIIKGKR